MSAMTAKIDMTFLEVLALVKDNQKMARRRRWPDGVVFSVDIKGKIDYYHVAATSLPAPPATDYLETDWIVVEDYGKDISYQWN
jgi:hypothetical protein